MSNWEVLYKTVNGSSANVNNSTAGSTKIFITFHRALFDAPSDTLVVTQICIILFNKVPLMRNKNGLVLKP